MQRPNIRPLREQARLTDEWLAERLQQLLPNLMRQAGMDMWILAADEHHESPLLRTLLPARIRLFSNRRTVLVLSLQENGLECLALSRFDYSPIYQNVWQSGKEEQWDCLSKLVAERDPQRIAINSSRESAFGGDLTVTLQKELMTALGAYSTRTASSEQLVLGWLQIKIKSELAIYPEVVSVAKFVVSEAFSGKTIQPGGTTGEEVTWAFRQLVCDLGLRSWFHPFVTVWRQARVVDLNQPILEGDVLHVDFGLEYLGLCTDHQQHAYVLRAGEEDAPEFLQQAMATGNRMQDILALEMQPGRSGNEVLAAALKLAEAEGIRTEISSHPVGYHGHGAGPLIGYWGEQQGVPGLGDGRILPDSTFAMELVVMCPIPQWDNRIMYMGMEEDVAVRQGGASVIGDQQRRFLLVR